MRITPSIIVAVAFLGLTGDGLLAQNYLAKDGQLTKPLKVVQLQGGFAGFTGVQYMIAPDGTWTSETIFNQKTTPKNKGKLSEKDLVKLGSILEKYDLAKLPAKSGQQPGANPHTLTFEFGRKKASLVGREPPRLDLKNPAGSVESRFAGIWQGVLGLAQSEPKDKKNE